MGGDKLWEWGCFLGWTWAECRLGTLQDVCDRYMRLGMRQGEVCDDWRIRGKCVMTGVHKGKMCDDWRAKGENA